MHVRVSDGARIATSPIEIESVPVRAIVCAARVVVSEIEMLSLAVRVCVMARLAESVSAILSVQVRE